jgi:hypothetical protein
MKTYSSVTNPVKDSCFTMALCMFLTRGLGTSPTRITTGPALLDSSGTMMATARQSAQSTDSNSDSQTYDYLLFFDHVWSKVQK